MASDLKAQFEQAARESTELRFATGQQTHCPDLRTVQTGKRRRHNTKRPGMTDFVGRAKWDAMGRNKGTTTDQAMQAYVDLINEVEGMIGEG